MNKFESIYRILMAFMVIDWHIDDREKEKIFNFFLTNYWETLTPEVQNPTYHKDKMWMDNFKADARIIYENFYREEVFEILDFIWDMIKADWKIDKKEVELLKILFHVWEVDEMMMEAMWLKKTFWLNYFNK